MGKQMLKIYFGLKGQLSCLDICSIWLLRSYIYMCVCIYIIYIINIIFIIIYIINIYIYIYTSNIKTHLCLYIYPWELLHFWKQWKKKNQHQTIYVIQTIYYLLDSLPKPPWEEHQVRRLCCRFSLDSMRVFRYKLSVEPGVSEVPKRHSTATAPHWERETETKEELRDTACTKGQMRDNEFRGGHCHQGLGWGRRLHRGGLIWSES